MSDDWSAALAVDDHEAPDLIPLPEDGGWGLLIAQAAGPQARYTAQVAKKTTLVSNGLRAARPRNLEEQAEIDAETAQYLRAAGLPPAPIGRDWFICRPEGMSDAAFWDGVNASIAEHGGGASSSPRAQRDAIRVYVHGLYALEGS